MVLLLPSAMLELSGLIKMLQENKPGPYVTEIKDATQFYGNRIIKEFKEKWVDMSPWCFYTYSSWEGIRGTSNGLEHSLLSSTI